MFRVFDVPWLAGEYVIGMGWYFAPPYPWYIEPLPMAHRTHYLWYIEPHINSTFNPLSMAYQILYRLGRSFTNFVFFMLIVIPR
jgi:hypothetical protein